MSTIAGNISEISLVCIPTPDQDRAIEFYESIGFQKRTDTPFGGSYRWVEVYPPQGSAGIALAPPRPGAEVTPMETGITLRTSDIDAAHAELKSLGRRRCVRARFFASYISTLLGRDLPDVAKVRDPSGVEQQLRPIATRSANLVSSRAIASELASGEIAGVKIKSAATVKARDFSGLRHLRDRLGERFQAGVVLYTGQRTLSFGDRLTAVPLCGLWC